MISKQAVLASQQIPEWIREEYPVFVSFVEAYYEYLDRNSMLRDLHSAKDLDNTLDMFIEAFKKDFMHNMPNMNNIDIREFLRNAKAFYTSKGSEASYRFLFRAMFGKEMTVYYPETDMLRVSDGRWQQEYSVILDVSAGNPFDIVGRKLDISTSNYRIITRVKKLDTTIYEFFFTNIGPINQLHIGDTIHSDSPLLTGIVKPVVKQVQITVPGSGFHVGQIFTVPGAGDTKFRVTKVDINGGLLLIKPVTFDITPMTEILDQKYDPISNTITVANDPSFGHINVFSGPIAKYQGFYVAVNGFLSDAVKIQDSYYYQIYSYVIKVDQQLSDYKALVKSLLHPAGLELFGEYIMTSEFDMSSAVDLIDKVLKMTPLDSFFIDDVALVNFVKSLSDSISLSDTNKYILSKALTDSVSMSDSGSIYRITPGNYDNYPTEQYFNPPEYYSQATQTLLYSW